jgi:hypothetical protein
LWDVCPINLIQSISHQFPAALQFISRRIWLISRDNVFGHGREKIRAKLNKILFWEMFFFSVLFYIHCASTCGVSVCQIVSHSVLLSRPMYAIDSIRYYLFERILNIPLRVDTLIIAPGLYVS